MTADSLDSKIEDRQQNFSRHLELNIRDVIEKVLTDSSLYDHRSSLPGYADPDLVTDAKKESRLTPTGRRSMVAEYLWLVTPAHYIRAVPRGIRLRSTQTQRTAGILNALEMIAQECHILPVTFTHDEDEEDVPTLPRSSRTT